MLPVYRRIIAALSELPIDAVVTTGSVDLGGELIGSDNVEVHGWVPHADLRPVDGGSRNHAAAPARRGDG